MDQLKQYWEIAKKQHFWILCGLCVLVPGIVFWVSSGHLAKVYADQITKIKGIDGGLAPLVGGTEHPNKEWVEHVKTETGLLRTNVKDAWEALYKQQQKILIWPPELQKDFIDAFSQPAASDDPRFLEPLCERYQNFVKSELSHMADIVSAEWAPSERAGGHGAPPPHGPEAAAEARKKYIVDWDSADQGRLMDNYDWVDPPSSLDVRYAQEELWVLEAICKSISRTNVGATGDFDAVVREIHTIEVGYVATNKFPLGEGAGRIERAHKSGRPGVPGAGAPMMTPGGPQGPAYEPAQPMRHRTTEEGALTGGHLRPPPRLVGMQGGQPNGAGPAGPAGPDDWLKDGRYVDTKGKPMRAADWANSTTPEFNLMAFKVVVAADEQNWQKLLIQLCNSPLPLEVREVRINAIDREGGRGSAGRDRPMRHEAGGPDMALHNVTLEIHGVAYLMNPPNLAKLGITAAGATPPAVPPATPAVATPPASPPAVAPATAAPTPAAPANGVTPPTTIPAVTPTTTPTTAPPTTTPPTVTPPTATPPNTTPPATGPAPAATTPTIVPPPTTTPATAPIAAPPAAAPAVPAGK